VADACDLDGFEIEAFEVLEGAAPFGADGREFEGVHFFSFLGNGVVEPPGEKGEGGDEG